MLQFCSLLGIWYVLVKGGVTPLDPPPPPWMPPPPCFPPRSSKALVSRAHLGQPSALLQELLTGAVKPLCNWLAKGHV